MASNRRQITPTGRATLIVLLALAATLAIAALATPASAEVVYANAPDPAVEPASLGFAASGTAELGSLVQLAGSDRLDPRVRFEAVVGECAAEPPAEACADPGASFALPATLSVYAVGPAGAPGELLARQTQTFQLADAATAQPLEFALTGVTLPAEAIVSLAFDTSTSGYAPSGTAGPADCVEVVLAGPPSAGANPREAEGVYRAVAADPAVPVFGFEADPVLGPGGQPALSVEAAPAPVPVAAAPAASASATTAATTAPRSFRREVRIPASKRMTVSFPRAIARVAGPGVLVQVRCTGSSAARCMGTLSLTAAGAVHKAPFSISKGRRQYVVVPLGEDLALVDDLGSARATATASTIQLGGAAVKTKRALKLK